MTSLFEQELLEMEREVRDMKTIHQRGLGTTRFYSATAEKTAAGSMVPVSFTINTYDDALIPIAFVPAVSLPTPIAVSSIVFTTSSDGSTASVIPIVYTAGTVKLKVMCSSVIKEII